jgi:hypothetical protein
MTLNISERQQVTFVGNVITDMVFVVVFFAAQAASKVNLWPKARTTAKHRLLNCHPFLCLPISIPSRVTNNVSSRPLPSPSCL